MIAVSHVTPTGWDILGEARTMLRAAAEGVAAGGWQRPTPRPARRGDPGRTVPSVRAG
jgi:hypothetical protein